MYLIKKCDVYFAPLIDKRLWFSCSLYASRLLSVESTIRFRLESIKTIKVRRFSCSFVPAYSCILGW